jgi:Cu/Ag efflux pump CusA
MRDSQRRAVDAGRPHRISELPQPLGYAMAGGLLVSQALTLFTTPVVCIYLDRLSNWHKRPLA